MWTFASAWNGCQDIFGTVLRLPSEIDDLLGALFLLGNIVEAVDRTEQLARGVFQRADIHECHAA
jgi:hypothetical protein